ncbi:MAG: hypothetical protein ACRDRL_24510 [Sciscionella sp.]
MSSPRSLTALVDRLSSAALGSEEREQLVALVLAAASAVATIDARPFDASPFIWAAGAWESTERQMRILLETVVRS